MINFHIEANQKNITSVIKTHLIDLTISDVLGDHADSLILTMADSKNQIQLPTTGESLKISLGKCDQMHLFGDFVVDEVSYRHLPTVIQVRAKSIRFDQSSTYQSMQSQKLRTFTLVTVKDIISLIADEHGLSFSVSDTIKNQIIDHIDQTNESNLSFLKRLARECSADLKVTHQRILFLQKNGLTTDNQNIKPVILDVNGLQNLVYSTKKRHAYQSIIVPYYNLDDANTYEVRVGLKEPIYRSNYVYDSKEKAKLIANKLLKDRNIESDSLTFSSIGNIYLTAGIPITIKGVRNEIPQHWVITKAEHKLNAQGYSVSIKASLHL